MITKLIKRTSMGIMLSLAFCFASYGSQLSTLITADAPTTSPELKTINMQQLDMDLCFSFIYPIQMTVPKQRNVTVASDDEMAKVIDGYVDSNPESEDYPDVVFPISIKDSDGKVLKVASSTELDKIFEDCFEADFQELDADAEDFQAEEEECFSFVYPVTMTRSNGQRLVLTQDSDWDKVDEDAFESDMTFKYPIKVKDPEGKTKVIANDAELDRLYTDCYPEYADDFDEDDICYDFVYPLNVKMADGSVQKVRSQEAFNSIVDKYLEKSDDFENMPDIAYPYTVVKADGSKQVIRNDKDQDNLDESCN